MANKLFKLELHTGGSVYKSKAATAPEALAALPRPVKLTSKAVLTIKHGKLRNSISLPVDRLKRLFYSKGTQSILMKTFVMGLK